MRKYILLAAGIVIVLAALIFWYPGNDQTEKAELLKETAGPSAEIVETVAEPSVNPVEEKAALADLVAKYKGLQLIDAHNHGASFYKYKGMLNTWKEDAVHQVVLFGNSSEPAAIDTDETAWNAYQQYPELIIPYFSGFDLHDKGSLEVVKNNLEKGYFGLGEVAGASTASPSMSKVAWKANDPMDGYLPQIYDLIAAYKAPILMHVDPPNGMPVAKLEEALAKHPGTIIIFAHINAYNTPEEVDRLLGKYPNLYADFFAGFSVYNPDSGKHPELYIPVMKKYPNRFMLSTDSGYGIGGEEQAIDAMYRMIDLLGDSAVARKIAHDNLAAIIEAQPATVTQMKALRKLEQQTGKSYDKAKLSKAEAGTILAEAAKGE
ncbi:amidohydrolase family protein [Paenibacillus sp. HW567]|uniref:amidohydrolase family protein n=1 Tax=Paenibacillus sp. HW567 TaxID=1034769 RepID=UPI000363BEAF|nr:amidohydrolase family protein [Paenibacillus sp. HW567]